MDNVGTENPTLSSTESIDNSELEISELEKQFKQFATRKEKRDLYVKKSRRKRLALELFMLRP